MENAPGADHAVKPVCPHELHARCTSAQLRRENTELRKRVGRLRSLHNDLAAFKQEKREMLDDFYRACARERKLKELVREEEARNASVLDALADLKWRKRSRNTRRLRLSNLKRAVFITQRSLEDAQYALMERDETIRKRNAEIAELSGLDTNCYLHVEETSARLRDAENALRDWKRLRARVNQVKREETPKLRRSGATDVLLTACSFALTLLLLLALISVIIPQSSRDEDQDNTCSALILGSF